MSTQQLPVLLNVLKSLKEVLQLNVTLEQMAEALAAGLELIGDSLEDEDHVELIESAVALLDSLAQSSQ